VTEEHARRPVVSSLERPQRGPGGLVPCVRVAVQRAVGRAPKRGAGVERRRRARVRTRADARHGVPREPAERQPGRDILRRRLSFAFRRRPFRRRPFRRRPFWELNRAPRGFRAKAPAATPPLSAPPPRRPARSSRAVAGSPRRREARRSSERASPRCRPRGRPRGRPRRRREDRGRRRTPRARTSRARSGGSRAPRLSPSATGAPGVSALSAPQRAGFRSSASSFVVRARPRAYYHGVSRRGRCRRCAARRRRAPPRRAPRRVAAYPAGTTRASSPCPPSPPRAARPPSPRSPPRRPRRRRSGRDSARPRRRSRGAARRGGPSAEARGAAGRRRDRPRGAGASRPSVPCPETRGARATHSTDGRTRLNAVATDDARVLATLGDAIVGASRGVVSAFRRAVAESRSRALGRETRRAPCAPVERGVSNPPSPLSFGSRKRPLPIERFPPRRTSFFSASQGNCAYDGREVSRNISRCGVLEERVLKRERERIV